MSFSSDEKKPTRTRGGGALTDPHAVKLHGNDFSLDEKLGGLAPEERKVVAEYIEKCEETLLQLSKRGCNTPIIPFNSENHSWDSLYKVNKRHFPLKNYIILAFPLLKSICCGPKRESKYIVECGCGTGSTLLPIMNQFKDGVHFIGFDVSTAAVSALLEHPIASDFSAEGRLTVFPYDLCYGCVSASEDCRRTKFKTECGTLKTTLLEKVPGCSKGVDAAILVFVLSSLPTIECMLYALTEIKSILHNDGILLFRDYAVPDHNLFRFVRQQNKKHNDLSFCKGDGTLQMFFELNFTRKLFALAGLKEVEGHGLQYHCNRIVNRKNSKRMDKIFINGSFCLS